MRNRLLPKNIGKTLYSQTPALKVWKQNDKCNSWSNLLKPKPYILRFLLVKIKDKSQNNTILCRLFELSNPSLIQGIIEQNQCSFRNTYEICCGLPISSVKPVSNLLLSFRLNNKRVHLSHYMYIHEFSFHHSLQV